MCKTDWCASKDGSECLAVCEDAGPGVITGGECPGGGKKLECQEPPCDSAVCAAGLVCVPDFCLCGASCVPPGGGGGGDDDSGLPGALPGDDPMLPG